MSPIIWMEDSNILYTATTGFYGGIEKNDLRQNKWIKCKSYNDFELFSIIVHDSNARLSF